MNNRIFSDIHKQVKINGKLVQCKRVCCIIKYFCDNNNIQSWNDERLYMSHNINKTLHTYYTCHPVQIVNIF